MIISHNEYPSFGDTTNVRHYLRLTLIGELQRNICNGKYIAQQINTRILQEILWFMSVRNSEDYKIILRDSLSKALCLSRPREYGKVREATW